MQELRLVAVSEDGSYAVLAVPGRSGRFSLPIDDRLRTVARGQFSRLAQYEIEVENPLRPKEIQDRIRAGETAEEIADAAGLPIERVRRFEGPVLAEREYRAQEAQRTTIRGQGEPGPGPRLGDVVAERLAEVGASAEETGWDSRKRPDGSWQVQLSFSVAGQSQVAEWVFDPRRRHVAPADEQAVALCLPDADWAATRFVARGPATATVTPIGSRHGAAGGYHPDARDEPERLAGRAGPGPWPGAAQPGVAQPGIAQPGVAQPGIAQPGVAQPGIAQPGIARGGAASVAGYSHGARPASARSPGAPRVAAAEPESAPQLPLPRPPAPAAASADGGRPADEPQEREQAARPGRKGAGGRSRRASVPSWDEIMLGNSRQRD